MSFSTWIRLTAHRVVSDGDLGKVITYTPKVFELCRVTYACGLMRMCVEFQDEILLRGGECETLEKSKFLRKGRIVKFNQNPYFFFLFLDLE